ncbi:MAG: DNA primase [Dehalococcoidia bacterium]|nr:DNA primase [Dehalococcoidia bacterium]
MARSWPSRLGRWRPRRCAACWRRSRSASARRRAVCASAGTPAPGTDRQAAATFGALRCLPIQSMSTIDDVKARLDIVETVGGYVPSLKRSGRTYKALCPFHSERTPSFTVDPERGTWHCFGACSTGGDVIEFVRRVEHLEFPEALRLCAQRAGVELRPPTRREAEQREVHDRLLRANEAAVVFFQAALDGPAGADALRYLDQRGVDQATRRHWQLGYAPAGWRELADYLLARGFTEADLLAAGLAVMPEGHDGGAGGAGRARNAYDRFRDRVTFPIRDARGRLVGFGARALRPEDDPKYLNTPQTVLFDKSGTLYGLDHAGEPARRADRLVVVEGYMDVIAAHQFGVANVVASMGTAITEKQMALVKRYTANVVLALDADTAGSEATLRGIEVAAGAADRETVATLDWRGLVAYQDVLQADIRVVTLPAGEDPDTLVRADPGRFRALVDGALSVTDHLFAAVSAAADSADPRSRSRALEALAPTVAVIADAVVRAHYVQRLARLGQVDERVVLALLARHGRRGGRREAPAAVPSPAEVRREARRSAAVPDGETQLLLLLLHRTEARAAGLALEEDVFEDATNRRLFAAWREPGALEERAEDLVDEAADELRERLAALRASLPEWMDLRYLESRYVEGAVAQIAVELRRRRAQRRFRPAHAGQAEAVTAARLSGGRVLEFAARAVTEGALPAEAASGGEEAAQVAAEFADLALRQRTLTREYAQKPQQPPRQPQPQQQGAGAQAGGGQQAESERRPANAGGESSGGDA